MTDQDQKIQQTDELAELLRLRDAILICHENNTTLSLQHRAWIQEITVEVDEKIKKLTGKYYPTTETEKKETTP